MFLIYKIKLIIFSEKGHPPGQPSSYQTLSLIHNLSQMKRKRQYLFTLYYLSLLFPVTSTSAVSPWSRYILGAQLMTIIHLNHLCGVPDLRTIR